MLQLPIRSCFHAARSSALATTKMKLAKTEMLILIIRPGNSGNDEVDCIIDCVTFFCEKGKGDEYYGSKKNSHRQHAGKKEGFLS